MKIIQVDDDEEPRAKRYQFNSHPKPDNNLRMIEMRLALEGMTTKDVVFDPYKEDRENHYYKSFYNVAFYQGPLFHPKEYIMADPRRVMRQLGFKQLLDRMTRTDEMYRLDLTMCNTGPTRLTVEYDPTPQPTHWSDKEPRRLVDFSQWEPVINGDEADPSYMDDYLEWSHPFIVRPANVEVPPQENPPVLTSVAPPPPTMAQLNNTVALFRHRIGKLKKMLGCKHKEGEVIAGEELKEVVEKLENIEDPNARALFGETRKVADAKKQKTMK